MCAYLESLGLIVSQAGWVFWASTLTLGVFAFIMTHLHNTLSEIDIIVIVTIIIYKIGNKMCTWYTGVLMYLCQNACLLILRGDSFTSSTNRSHNSIRISHTHLNFFAIFPSVWYTCILRFCLLYTRQGSKLTLCCACSRTSIHYILLVPGNLLIIHYYL